MTQKLLHEPNNAKKNSKINTPIFDNMLFFPSKTLPKTQQIIYNPRILWGGEAPDN